MNDRRKLNDVYTKPCTRGFITIIGVIGSGKTREEVVLKERSAIDSTEVIEWMHMRGEQWKLIKHKAEA
ncbi:MAG: hypothetical protein PHH48_06435 [Eubacteriales bacterium]|nr:hypothetical protein [Eubacteriales bacterium]